MTTSDYITRRYGSNRNRHWWGIAHRQWLLNSGRYVYTTRPSERALRGTKTGLANLIVGEPGPELVNFRPHHRGAALWMPSEPGGRHWPGCGCP